MKFVSTAAVASHIRWFAITGSPWPTPLERVSTSPGKNQWPTPRSKVSTSPDRSLRLPVADPPSTRVYLPWPEPVADPAHLGVYLPGSQPVAQHAVEMFTAVTNVHTGTKFTGVNWSRNSLAKGSLRNFNTASLEES